MSGRATAVLQRFPRHLGLTDPGKRIGGLAEAVAAHLDDLGRRSGDVLRSHRVASAPTRLDLDRLGSIHRLSDEAFEPLTRRLAHLRHVMAATPDDTGAIAAAAGALADDLAAAAPDEVATWRTTVGGLDAELDLLRGVLLGVIAASRVGNGTPSALLLATAAYLGLRPGEIEHAADGWWHLTTVHDALATAAPADADPDWLALEENPFVPGGITGVERAHADRFRILRGGLERVVVSVEVTGLGERTMAPMVVNLDTGHGVVFDGAVPDGQTLTFSAAGLVDIDGSAVTGDAFAFAGAVFAAGPPGDTRHPRDFVFADESAGDRSATFVTTAPIGEGFAEGRLPHGAAGIPSLSMAVGESRWAFFVRHAHFAAGVPVVPSFGAGRFDGSVYAPTLVAPDTAAACALVRFSWEEREPFALRVLLPQRLADADDDDGTRLREPVRTLLDRHRAAGVHVYVEYADDRWVLGAGVIRDADTPEAIGTVVDGTTLWAVDDAPQPPSD